MKTTKAKRLGALLGIRESRALEATVKAQMIAGILQAASELELTHAEIASRSGLPRSAVTGILSGSLQKVTIDRLLRLLEAVGLTVEVKLRSAA